MATILRFEDLEIWKMARELANEVFTVYSNSNSFSKDYKLKEQINGSSGSVMDNIAEGFARGSRNEFINFLSIAKGSIAEVKSQLYRAHDRDYISSDAFDSLYNKADEISKKVAVFIKYLNSTGYKGTKFKDRNSQTENTKL
ncbi:MAG: four helix bundle protein [Candidatus Dadabacteria bacterium]